MDDDGKEIVLLEDAYSSYINDNFINKVTTNVPLSPIEGIDFPLDAFKGKRAWNKENSLMKTQRAEGSLITWTREELYD